MSKKSFRKLDTPEKLELNDLDRLAEGNPEVKEIVNKIKSKSKLMELYGETFNNYKK